MKRYIKSSNATSGKYIGGRLYDLPDSYWDDEDDDLRAERYEEQAKYIQDFASWYIVHWLRTDQFALYQSDANLLSDLTEMMAIKDGIDVIAYPEYIKIAGYYNMHTDAVCLYPISQAKASELIDLIDNTDFDETAVIDGEIAQSAWDGSSVEDVLKSWR